MAVGTEQPDTALATGSATDQPHVAMDQNDAHPPNPVEDAIQNGELEMHVAFNNGMWWAMPSDLANGIVYEWLNGSHEVSFIWDWGETRPGSFCPDGEVTSINRYIIDFRSMQQRNTDNGRTRAVKLVRVLRV